MRLVRALASTALVAGATVMVAPAPAGAATCSGGNGVSVVVDYRELGGSTVTACAPDGGGKSAAAIFAEAGVQITYAQRQPGFVCRVNGVPTSDPCVNTSPPDAFWGLWWSDGSRPWTYASSGVGSLTVPAGGSVGWSWQQDRAAGQAVPPGVPAPSAPPASQSSSPSPSPSSSSSPSASHAPTAAPGSASSSTPTRSPQPTASPTKRPDGPRPSAATDSPSSSRSEASASAPSTSSATASNAPGARTKSRQRAEKAPDEAVEPSASASSASPEAPTESPTAPEAAADEPTRIPAALTWGVVASLGAAVLGSALVSRRRRRA